MLTFRKYDSLEIVGYPDADYVVCVDNHKSTFGYVFMTCGGAISRKNVKQTLIANSTMEAEYIACYKTTCQAM